VTPAARVFSARKQLQMNGILQREFDARNMHGACVCKRSLSLVRYCHIDQTTKEGSRVQFRPCLSDSHKLKLKRYRRWCFRAL